MELGPHAGFIIAAYAAGALIVLGLIAWIVVDYRVQRRTLAELDQRGVKRRAGHGRQDTA
jgi:heme exporter protein D